MTALELADELEKRHLLGGYASEAATMLRQQHSDLEHMWMANTVLEAEIKFLNNFLDQLEST